MKILAIADEESKYLWDFFEKSKLDGIDLIISCANPMASDDWTTTTVTLKGCIFIEDCLESQQDDTNITHEFDLNPFDIQIGSGDTI